MSDPKQIKRILTKVKKLWKLNPDMKFCQLVSTLTYPVQDIHFISDEGLEILINNAFEKPSKCPERQTSKEVICTKQSG